MKSSYGRIWTGVWEDGRVWGGVDGQRKFPQESNVLIIGKEIEKRGTVRKIHKFTMRKKRRKREQSLNVLSVTGCLDFESQRKSSPTSRVPRE